MCKKRIEELRELSNQIPIYNRKKPEVDGIKEVVVENGIAVGQILFIDDEDRIAVAKVSMEANTHMEYHDHKEKQIMTVYEGEIIIVTGPSNDKKTMTLTAGSTYIIEPNIPHGIISPVRTRMIVQMIPASNDSKRWKNS